MRPLSHCLTRCLVAAALVGAAVTWAVPASAHGDGISRADAEEIRATAGSGSLIESSNVAHVGSHPSQLGISGCFLRTAPLFVASGLDSVRVYDVSDGAAPELTGVLPSLQFENEAMNCGERVTAHGTRRFALIGVDSFQASPDDIQHANVGGGELVIVDVTDPASPHVLARTPVTSSTHTVTCVRATDCAYAYSAGDGNHFSIFDLRNLSRPREVDSKPDVGGVQPFWSPTAGHKWNFDAAGIGSHTGWNGASMWSTATPSRPRLLTTTTRAGRGDDPAYAGYNDFILHNSFRPNAGAFRAGAAPSYRNGNVLLVTEEDYEQTDCARAGSFQTWWVRRLDGTRNAIVPLDKVELNDLGSFPLPQGAFCSSHWFDWNATGIVAAGFYGGGTQLIDARNPRDLKPFGHAVWGASEVWDAMWLPGYDARGHQTGQKTNVVYSIDLVRGLDVYAVDMPGDGIGAVPPPATSASGSPGLESAPVTLVAGAALVTVALRRRVRTT